MFISLLTVSQGFSIEFLANVISLNSSIYTNNCLTRQKVAMALKRRGECTKRLEEGEVVPAWESGKLSWMKGSSRKNEISTLKKTHMIQRMSDAPTPCLISEMDI